VSLKLIRIWQDFKIQFDCLMLCFSTLFRQLESRKKLRHMNDILKICIVSLWLDLRRINLFCMFCAVVHVLVLRILRACFSSEYPE
jgi:diacylglycerol kinase